MQQTQKYKLNLIESSDPFLPEALNQNTQKLENALSAAIEEHRAETDARLTVLEGHKIYFGYFTAPTSGSTLHVPLPFAPKAVFCSGINGGGFSYLSTIAKEHFQLHLVEDGFEATSLQNQTFIAFC